MCSQRETFFGISTTQLQKAPLWLLGPVTSLQGQLLCSLLRGSWADSLWPESNPLMGGGDPVAANSSLPSTCQAAWARVVHLQLSLARLPFAGTGTSSYVSSTQRGARSTHRKCPVNDK